VLGHGRPFVKTNLRRCRTTDQQEAAQQQQQPPQPLPAGLEGQVPSSEALAALYQQLGGGRPQGAPPMDAGYGQQVCKKTVPHLLSLQ
jgi:hypothetical protein